MNLKLDKITKIFLGVLILSISLLWIISLGNTGDYSDYSNEMIENNEVYSTFGYVVFFLLGYSVYLSIFIIWLILLIITKQDVQKKWQTIQLIMIFILAILPTIVFDILLIK